MPTETVYGLAADATNDRAVAAIFAAKSRPQFNPLIAHVADVAMAIERVIWSSLAEKLAGDFWPGPLTMVLPRRADCDVSLLASAGQDTLGVRAPNHELARALIRAVGRPLAAPSANRSGAISPTSPQHVRDSLGDRVDWVLDGGACRIGVESTIIRIEDDHATLLRSGGVERAALEEAIGAPLCTPQQTEKPQAPGMLESHYAPTARLRVNARDPRPDEAYLGFGDCARNDTIDLNLSVSGSMIEAAANLFAHLHHLDAACQKSGLTTIAVAPIPSTGLGEAINDRLQRAAAPRQSSTGRADA